VFIGFATTASSSKMPLITRKCVISEVKFVYLFNFLIFTFRFFNYSPMSLSPFKNQKTTNVAFSSIIIIGNAV
jgi:hypothetical protein